MPILSSSLLQILCVRFLELHVRTSDVLYRTVHQRLYVCALLPLAYWA